MKAVVDTSSFVALARYYLPFDSSGKLSQLIESRHRSGEIVVLDAINEECRYHAQGLAIKAMPYLAEKNRIISTDKLIPTRKFLNMLENQFCEQTVRTGKGINDAQFEVEKTAYLESGDGRLLLYSALLREDELVVVTEETASANDNKLFKKIPACCKELGIDVVGLPTFIERTFGSDLGEILSG